MWVWPIWPSMLKKNAIVFTCVYRWNQMFIWKPTPTAAIAEVWQFCASKCVHRSLLNLPPIRHELQHFSSVMHDYIANQLFNLSWQEFEHELHHKVRLWALLIHCHWLAPLPSHLGYTLGAWCRWTYSCSPELHWESNLQVSTSQTSGLGIDYLTLGD